mmetsp:Transcript_68214/g.142149  ORF Transcript_68214/g.142149 Transcript_68214/m.142149 type:complete len:136 (-) Transcript_68214:94-501(-)
MHRRNVLAGVFAMASASLLYRAAFEVSNSDASRRTSAPTYTFPIGPPKELQELDEVVRQALSPPDIVTDAFTQDRKIFDASEIEGVHLNPLAIHHAPSGPLAKRFRAARSMRARGRAAGEYLIQAMWSNGSELFE